MNNLLLGLFLGGIFFGPLVYLVMRQRGLEGHWRVVRQYIKSPAQTIDGLIHQLELDAKRLEDEMED